MDRQIINFLPPIMREYEEIKQICNSEQKTKEKMRNDLYNVFNQSFLATQTEAGAERWEKTLGILAKDTDTLEDRAKRIAAKLQDDLPYTIRTFKKRLRAFAEDKFVLIVDWDKCYIEVQLECEFIHLINEVAEFADMVVPAHLILVVDEYCNTHEILSKYPHFLLEKYTEFEVEHKRIPLDPTLSTHRSLRKYTHKELKEFNHVEILRYLKTMKGEI